MTPFGKASLALAARGLRVLPLPPRKKYPPLFAGWQEHATTDPDKIRNWWREDPNNIGIATGPDSGVWVLDVDGDEGEATLRKLETEHGALAPTVEVITGDGRHLYFRWPTGTEIRNAQCRDDVPGLDWRGAGGYVMAPPSVHPSGRVYRWSVDSANELSDAPDWLIKLVTSKNRSVGSTATPEQWLTFLAQHVDGSRRGSAIARLTGYLLRRFVDPAITLDLMRFFNDLRCEPPLDDEELIRIVVSIGRREAERRERTP